jgi:hypothetical protein
MSYAGRGPLLPQQNCKKRPAVVDTDSEERTGSRSFCMVPGLSETPGEIADHMFLASSHPVISGHTFARALRPTRMPRC